MDGSGRFAPPLHSESTESLVDVPTTPRVLPTTTRGGSAPAARVSTAQRWKMAKSNRNHAKSHGSMRLSSNLDKTRWHDVKEEVSSRRRSGHHRALGLPRSAPHHDHCALSSRLVLLAPLIPFLHLPSHLGLARALSSSLPSLPSSCRLRAWRSRSAWPPPGSPCLRLPRRRSRATRRSLAWRLRRFALSRLAWCGSPSC